MSIAASLSPLKGPGYVRVASPMSGASTILGADGNPYRKPIDPLRPATKAEVSAVFRDLPVSLLEQDWTVTDIRQALAEHAMGLFARSGLLIDTMIGDDRIQSALGSRVGALMGLDEIHEQAAEDTDGAALEAWKAAWPKCHAPEGQGDVLHDIRSTTLMGGFHVSEIVWDTMTTPWQPYLKPWHLQHVYYDWARRMLVALTEDGPEPIIPGNGRWFVHAPTGVYRGYLQGLVRALALPWLLRLLARRDWARYSERHGMPIIGADVPEMADEADKERFRNDLANMGTEAVVMLPRGIDGQAFNVRLIEAASQSWEGFDRLIIRCENAITLAVQWQNLTTEVKEGSQAAARVHADVKQSAVELDDRALANDIQWQIGRPFALWNFGDARKAPRTRRDVEVLEDRVSTAQALVYFGQACAAMAQAGVNFDPVALARRYRVKLELQEGTKHAPPIYSYHLTAGIVRRDEMRGRLGLDPIGGEEGNELLGAPPAGGGEGGDNAP